MSDTISLQKSIRTCKVNTGNADRLDSDRWLNSNNTLCPVWTGYDLAGRKACTNSFYTKSEGCNSANDRIFVENDLRPKYFDYIALNAAGVSGNIYGNSNAAAVANRIKMNNINNITGQFGQEWPSDVRNTACSINPYDTAVNAQNKRNASNASVGYFSNGYRNASN